MLSVYILSAVFGGSLLLLSALGASGDDADGLDTDSDVDGALDFDADVDVDVDVDVDADVEVGGTAMVNGAVDGADLQSWLPFFSLRFWIYFSATFGLSGAVITYLELTSALITAGLSAGAGTLAGTAMVATVRALKKGEATSLQALDFESSEATVSTPIRPGELGKIRTHVRGEWIDLLAETTGRDVIEPGARVIIVEMKDTKAVVVPAETIID